MRPASLTPLMLAVGAGHIDVVKVGVATITIKILTVIILKFPNRLFIIYPIKYYAFLS